MKRRYKKYTQEDFAELLEIEQPQVSRLLKGIEKISFPLSVKLSRLFPGKGIMEWKESTNEDLKNLFDQCKLKAELQTKHNTKVA